MNLFELLIFLVVTATAGALIGVVVGTVLGDPARWASVGAIAGPIVAAVGITVYVMLRKSR